MIYQISSGQGPAECELGVAKFLTYLQKHYAVSVLETSQGHYENTYRSVRLETKEDLSQFIGSVQWICQSPYRPGHKRKNWFLDFSSCSTAETETFDTKLVRFETFRSSGKGGQNVNKVETGVRAIYLPTGQIGFSTDERSQYLNRQKALERLKAAVETENQKKQAKLQNDNWGRHTNLERGNAKVRFEGRFFREVGYSTPHHKSQPYHFQIL